MFSVVVLVEETAMLLETPGLDTAELIDEERTLILEALDTTEDVELLPAIEDMVVEVGPVYR